MQKRQSRSPLLPWELGVASASGVWEPDLDFSEHTTALRSDVSKLLLQPPPAHSMEEETEVLGGRRLPAAACSPVCWPSCWAQGRRYPGEALPCLPGTRLCLRLTDQASPTSENPRTVRDAVRGACGPCPQPLPPRPVPCCLLWGAPSTSPELHPAPLLLWHVVQVMAEMQMAKTHVEH